MTTKQRRLSAKARLRTASKNNLLKLPHDRIFIDILLNVWDKSLPKARNVTASLPGELL